FEFRPDVVLSLRVQKRPRHAEIVGFRLKFRRHLQSFLSIKEVSYRSDAQSFECGAVGVGCFPCWIFPKVADFEFARTESRDLIVGKHTEVFEGDRTRTNRDDSAHSVGMRARISEAEDHAPRISEHDKFPRVQLL